MNIKNSFNTYMKQINWNKFPEFKMAFQLFNDYIQQIPQEFHQPQIDQDLLKHNILHNFQFAFTFNEYINLIDGSNMEDARIMLGLNEFGLIKGQQIDIHKQAMKFNESQITFLSFSPPHSISKTFLYSLQSVYYFDEITKQNIYSVVINLLQLLQKQSQQNLKDKNQIDLLTQQEIAINSINMVFNNRIDSVMLLYDITSNLYQKQSNTLNSSGIEFQLIMSCFNVSLNQNIKNNLFRIMMQLNTIYPDMINKQIILKTNKFTINSLQFIDVQQTDQLFYLLQILNQQKFITNKDSFFMLQKRFLQQLVQQIMENYIQNKSQQMLTIDNNVDIELLNAQIIQIYVIVSIANYGQKQSSEQNLIQFMEDEIREFMNIAIGLSVNMIEKLKLISIDTQKHPKFNMKTLLQKTKSALAAIFATILSPTYYSQNTSKFMCQLILSQAVVDIQQFDFILLGLIKSAQNLIKQSSNLISMENEAENVLLIIYEQVTPIIFSLYSNSQNINITHQLLNVLFVSLSQFYFFYKLQNINIKKSTLQIFQNKFKEGVVQQTTLDQQLQLIQFTLTNANQTKLQFNNSISQLITRKHNNCSIIYQLLDIPQLITNIYTQAINTNQEKIFLESFQLSIKLYDIIHNNQELFDQQFKQYNQQLVTSIIQQQLQQNNISTKEIQYIVQTIQTMIDNQFCAQNMQQLFQFMIDHFVQMFQQLDTDSLNYYINIITQLMKHYAFKLHEDQILLIKDNVDKYNKGLFMNLLYYNHNVEEHIYNQQFVKYILQYYQDEKTSINLNNQFFNNLIQREDEDLFNMYSNLVYFKKSDIKSLFQQEISKFQYLIKHNSTHNKDDLQQKVLDSIQYCDNMGLYLNEYLNQYYQIQKSQTDIKLQNYIFSQERIGTFLEKIFYSFYKLKNPHLLVNSTLQLTDLSIQQIYQGYQRQLQQMKKNQIKLNSQFQAVIMESEFNIKFVVEFQHFEFYNSLILFKISNLMIDSLIISMEENESNQMNLVVQINNQINNYPLNYQICEIHKLEIEITNNNNLFIKVNEEFKVQQLNQRLVQYLNSSYSNTPLQQHLFDSAKLQLLQSQYQKNKIKIQNICVIHNNEIVDLHLKEDLVQNHHFILGDQKLIKKFINEKLCGTLKSINQDSWIQQCTTITTYLNIAIRCTFITRLESLNEMQNFWYLDFQQFMYLLINKISDDQIVMLYQQIIKEVTQILQNDQLKQDESKIQLLLDSVFISMKHIKQIVLKEQILVEMLQPYICTSIVHFILTYQNSEENNIVFETLAKQNTDLILCELQYMNQVDQQIIKEYVEKNSYQENLLCYKNFQIRVKNDSTQQVSNSVSQYSLQNDILMQLLKLMQFAQNNAQLQDTNRNILQNESLLKFILQLLNYCQCFEQYIQFQLIQLNDLIITQQNNSNQVKNNQISKQIFYLLLLSLYLINKKFEQQQSQNKQLFLTQIHIKQILIIVFQHVKNLNNWQQEVIDKQFSTQLVIFFNFILTEVQIDQDNIVQLDKNIQVIQQLVNNKNIDVNKHLQQQINVLPKKQIMQILEEYMIQFLTEAQLQDNHVTSISFKLLMYLTKSPILNFQQFNNILILHQLPQLIGQHVHKYLQVADNNVEELKKIQKKFSNKLDLLQDSYLNNIQINISQDDFPFFLVHICNCINKQLSQLNKVVQICCDDTKQIIQTMKLPNNYLLIEQNIKQQQQYIINAFQNITKAIIYSDHQTKSLYKIDNTVIISNIFDKQISNQLQFNDQSQMQLQNNPLKQLLQSVTKEKNTDTFRNLLVQNIIQDKNLQSTEEVLLFIEHLLVIFPFIQEISPLHLQLYKIIFDGCYQTENIYLKCLIIFIIVFCIITNRSDLIEQICQLQATVVLQNNINSLDKNFENNQYIQQKFSNILFERLNLLSLVNKLNQLQSNQLNQIINLFEFEAVKLIIQGNQVCENDILQNHLFNKFAAAVNDLEFSDSNVYFSQFENFLQQFEKQEKLQLKLFQSIIFRGDIDRYQLLVSETFQILMNWEVYKQHTKQQLNNEQIQQQQTRNQFQQVTAVLYKQFLRVPDRK